MKKRLLSIFLVLSMLCSFLPTSVYAEGETVPLTITDTITTDGHLTVTGGTGPYTWQKKTGTGNYEDITYTAYETVGSNIAKDGSWLSVVLTGGGITESSYVTYKVTDAAGTSVEFAQTKYSAKLLNGSFETPSIKSSYWSQLSVNTSGLIWKTTAVGDGIEIVRASSGNLFFGVSTAPDGNQFAELNCEQEGSLYQDVMTVPGETLNWSFAHRARLQSYWQDIHYYEGEDTMALVIMDANKFGTTINTQEDILKVVADPTTYGAYVLTNSAGGSWETVSGNYVVPEDQYMTRFFFVSISAASGNKTVGNLIDNVKFSSEKTPVPDTATLSIKKVATSTDTTLTTFPNPTIKIYEYVAPTTVGGTGTKGNLLWTVTLTANSTTATEIINVPVGTYYIEESDAELTGYSLATTYSVTNPFTITDTDLDASKAITVTNTYTKTTTDVSVTKVWEDNDNQDGLRTDSVTVELYADNVTTGKTLTLNSTNNWSGKFENLDLKTSTGTTITYTVKETAITGYETTITGSQSTGFTVTNTHTPEKTSIDVTKSWDDNGNQDGIRKDSVTVILVADGVETETTLVLSEDNNWTGSFTDLDKYKEGKEIVYTVKEVAVDGYTSEVVENENGGFTITNTHTPEKTSVSVTKTWNDNDNQDGIRPEEITVYLYADDAVKETVTIKPNADGNWSYTFTDLDKYDNGKAITYTVGEKAVNGYTTNLSGNVETEFVITNTHTPEKTNLPVNKVWKDNGNQDGYRPENITVELLADGVETTTTLTLNANNNWADTFVNLDKYKNGKEIVYSVKEVTINEHYTSVVEKNANGGYTVTNTHETEQTEIAVSKAWSDNDDQDGVRPSSVTVVLVADGTNTDKTLVLNENNNWSGSFTNLDKYKDGKEIVYSVKELSVAGYTTEITKTSTGDYSITNTHTTATTSIDVTKSWQDNNNNDGIRPESITVVLLADGVETSKTLVLTNDNNWSGSFTDLDKYKDHGKEIKYTVKELTISGYTTVITGSQSSGYAITNTHENEKISLPVTKTWNDNDDQDGYRVESITVVLVADGVGTETTLVLSKENNWSGSFTELDKYKEGKEVVYTIKELSVDKYTLEIAQLTDGGYNITNTHTPETTSISGTKHWDDNDNQDGARPNEITVNLLADGVIYKTIIVTEATDWTYTFEDLPVYRDHGTEIVYTISEEAVDYYTTTYDKFDIINTHTPNKINVKVTKVWDDKDNKDQIRPKEVVVYLVINGDETDIQVTLSKDNGWTSYFTELDEYDNGEKVEYTVKEKEVNGYTTTYTGDMTDGFVITNSHTPIPVPDTGDHSHIFLWIAVLTVSTAALATAVVLKKRKINE